MSSASSGSSRPCSSRSTTAVSLTVGIAPYPDLAAQAAYHCRCNQEDFSVVAFRPNPPDADLKASYPPRRILLIENDLAVEDMLRTILEGQGYSVVIAHSPSEAIAALAVQTFHLIITDGFSRLPQDVLANAAELLVAAGTTPVALFTAHPIELDAAGAAGFRDLIAKPFDLETFEHQVRTLLSPSTPRTDRDGRAAAKATADGTTSRIHAR